MGGGRYTRGGRGRGKAWTEAFSDEDSASLSTDLSDVESPKEDAREESSFFW